jgi:hypothetical protein
MTSFGFSYSGFFPSIFLSQQISRANEHTIFSQQIWRKNLSNKLMIPPVQLHTKLPFQEFSISPCLSGLSPTTQRYFSRRTNRHQPTSQLYFFQNKSTPVTNQASRLLVFKDNFQVMHKNQTKPASLA